MKRSLILLALGCLVVTLSSNPAWAQRGGRRSGNVNTPYGQFSAAEMAQAGGDAATAAQYREQKQMMQYQQQMLKQQQLAQQQQAKQQEFFKKHPEAARALTQPTKAATPKKATSKAAKKTKEKEPATDVAGSQAKASS